MGPLNCSGAAEVRLPRLLLATWMVRDGKRVRLGEVRLRWRPEGVARPSSSLLGATTSFSGERLLCRRSIRGTLGSSSFSNMIL